MARKRTDSGGEAKGGSRHTQPRFAFHLDQELLDAAEAYCKGQRLVPEKSEVMRVALREFLEREGFWPPPGGKS
jgi:hypothetical protein